MVLSTPGQRRIFAQRHSPSRIERSGGELCRLWRENDPRTSEWHPHRGIRFRPWWTASVTVEGGRSGVRDHTARPRREFRMVVCPRVRRWSAGFCAECVSQKNAGEFRFVILDLWYPCDFSLKLLAVFPVSVSDFFFSFLCTLWNVFVRLLTNSTRE